MSNGAVDCFKKIYQKEGIESFYKRACSRLVARKANPAFVLVLYDELQKVFAASENR